MRSCFNKSKDWLTRWKVSFLLFFGCNLYSALNPKLIANGALQIVQFMCYIIVLIIIINKHVPSAVIRSDTVSVAISLL